MTIDERLKKRYAKFRAHGHFEEKIELAADAAIPAAPAGVA
jgi:hypothetical protein